MNYDSIDSTFLDPDDIVRSALFKHFYQQECMKVAEEDLKELADEARKDVRARLRNAIQNRMLNDIDTAVAAHVRRIVDDEFSKALLEAIETQKEFLEVSVRSSAKKHLGRMISQIINDQKRQ